MIGQKVREKQLWEDIRSDLNRPLIWLAKDSIKTKADAYFFLKKYCIMNLVLISKEQRERFLRKIERECGLNGKVRK